jgi:hypothetical protein
MPTVRRERFLGCALFGGALAKVHAAVRGADPFFCVVLPAERRASLTAAKSIVLILPPHLFSHQSRGRAL